MKKTALVTGGTGGIGTEIVACLQREGLRVLAPPRARLNLSSEDSIVKFLKSLREPVDVLVNNAGINILGSSSEVPEGQFEEVLKINLIAPFRVAGVLAQGMKTRKYGRIVNLSSIWALVAKERRLTYAASKSGLDGLTRALAVELAPYGVLVNALAPGYVNTALTKNNNSPQELEVIVKTIPLGRLAEPSEIAECVAFLCSERNTYITGQVLVADGGYTCR